MSIWNTPVSKCTTEELEKRGYIIQEVPEANTFALISTKEAR